MTSHMKKKKAKRYQEGGEAEDKKRGLAASNKEGSVGFFERLRMGNIDDPKSEAYKRFGAGRGKAEAAKQRAAMGSKEDRERDSREAAVAGPLKSQAAAPMEDKKPAKAASNPAIVTIEQLKASRFDNLRDYLNDQRGLTRRGESSPRKPAADKAVSRGPSRGTQDEGDAGEEELVKRWQIAGQKNEHDGIKLQILV
jgi:hypothetical protein